MLTFIILFTLLMFFIEFETYMNYGHIIVTRATLIAPLIFAFYGQVLITIFQWLREKDKSEEAKQDATVSN